MHVHRTYMKILALRNLDGTRGNTVDYDDGGLTQVGRLTNAKNQQQFRNFDHRCDKIVGGPSFLESQVELPIRCGYVLNVQSAARLVGPNLRNPIWDFKELQPGTSAIKKIARVREKYVQPRT